MFTIAVNSTYANQSVAFGLNTSRTVQANREDSFLQAMPAAGTGALTTRTSNTAGTITQTAHGYSTSDKVDLFWASNGHRLAVNVDSTPTADTFTFSTGSGDDLPVEDSTVYTAEPVSFAFAVDVSETVAAALHGQYPYVFRTNSASSPDEEWHFGAFGGFVWDEDSVFTNPLVTDITALYITNGSPFVNPVQLRNLRSL